MPSFQACGRSSTPTRAVHEPDLELEAQDDVQVVGGLVGLDADEAAPDRVDRAVERVGVDAPEPGQELAEPRQHPGAERPAAADLVLPQPALGLVHAERDRVAERRGHEPRRDARLVEPVAELVQAAEVRAREVVQVVARGDARVAGRDALGEGMRGRVEAPAVGVEADALEHGHHRAPLVLDLVVAVEDAGAVVGAVRLRDQGQRAPPGPPRAAVAAAPSSCPARSRRGGRRRGARPPGSSRRSGGGAPGGWPARRGSGSSRRPRAPPARRPGRWRRRG